MAKKSTEKYQNAQSNEMHYLDTVSNEIKDVRESMNRITAKELSENPKKYYGEYVNYNVDLNGDKDYTNDWKLFYVGGSDKEDSAEVQGRIYLIAADYVPMDNKELEGVVATEGSNTYMKPAILSGFETLSAYWGSSAPAYQPLDKLNSNPIKLFMHEGYNLNNKSDNPNSAATSTLLNTKNWESFAKGKYGEVAIGGPTLEMWCKAWNQVVDTTDEKNKLVKLYANGDNTSGYGYYWGITKDTKNSNNMYMNGTANEMTDLTKLGEDYPLFFPHTTYIGIKANGKEGNCSGYWLASPSSASINHMVRVFYLGRVSNLSYDITDGHGLRPLVCLEEGVKLQKNLTKSNETRTIYDIVK